MEAVTSRHPHHQAVQHFEPPKIQHKIINETRFEISFKKKKLKHGI